MSRPNRPCLLCKVTPWVKVKPAIFGLSAHAHGASPAVSGLQKPPAGSRREGGGGEGGNGPGWKQTVDMGRGQLLSHGRGTLWCNPEGGSQGPGGLSAPTAASTATSLQACAHFSGIPMLTGPCTVQKACVVIRENEKGEGSQTHSKSQL